MHTRNQVLKMPECPRCFAFTEDSETRAQWRRLLYRWFGRRSFKCPVCRRHYSLLAAKRDFNRNGRTARQLNRQIDSSSSADD